MSSNDHSEPLDLARGLPTGPGDVAALRELSAPRMDDAAYVRMLLDLQPSDTSALKNKRGPRGEPFRLED
jgi:hypothetical protein